MLSSFRILLNKNLRQYLYSRNPFRCACRSAVAAETPHGKRNWYKHSYRKMFLFQVGFVTLASSVFDTPRPPRRKNRNGARNFSKEKQLFDAIRRNSIEEVRALLSTGDVDVNFRHQLGWSPLHLAVVSGSFDIVEMLLKAGADPNLGDNFTNIYDKAQELGISSLDVMLWRDAEFSDRYHLNTNRSTFRGCTALHYAVNLKDKGILMALLEAGADPTIENDMGYLPSDYVIDENMHAVLEEWEQKFDIIKKERIAAERIKYPLEKRLRNHLVGQEAAIRTVSSAIRRWQSGWADDEHPLVMLFLGSSGIGKTELAKQIAAHLTKSESGASKKDSGDSSSKGFIRLDMSEYQEKHSVARLIGSPPGYIGHDEGGQLTSKLSACPNAVVLFDEIEKAHPDVLTVLLQLFDEGRMTDGKGETIKCTQAIFIMTSNLASEEIAAYSQRLRNENDGIQSFEDISSETESLPVWVSKKFKDDVIRPILKSHFKRDEFLGRINEFVYFLPFSRRELMQLVTKELALWADRAAKRHSITIVWDRSALNALADGYNIHYGARSIKHEVERQVIDRLAAAHDLKLIGANSVVRIVGDRNTDEETLLENRFDAKIRIQIKSSSHKGVEVFEDLDDKLLLSAADSAKATETKQKKH